MGSRNRAKLRNLSDKARDVLLLAKTLGQVVFVTNAKQPWVEYSCGYILPGLKSVLKDIPILYALECIGSVSSEVLGNVDSAERCALLTESKACAMENAVTEFYSRYPDQSWKNLISIGDAFFEHDAIRLVTSKRPLRGDSIRRCRCKTIKLLEGPSLTGMIFQLSLIENLLVKIVQHDDDVDMDMTASEAQLNNWLTQFGSNSSHVAGEMLTSTVLMKKGRFQAVKMRFLPTAWGSPASPT